MHGDWKGPYSKWLQRKASERGRRMANARWTKFRTEQNRLAALTAEQDPPHIVERLVRIVNECQVSETVIWSWDSAREAYRKKRRLLFKAES